MTKLNLAEELKWRGFVNQTTLKDTNVLNNGSISFYWGVDPSADSMTIGNLAAAMMVKHFINHGHKAYLLIGGATGMIGDPDGKKEERSLKSLEEIDKNKKAITQQYKNIFEGEKFTIVDNYDWFKNINYLEFLRDIGKHVPIRQMIARDFVQSRLGEGGAGISYAEFSYSLIQGYDFLHLHQKYGVNLQVCGADQWGNSITGVDLIRRKTGDETHVWSTPLVVNKQTGQKFGKTEDGAIWLDPDKTSPNDFYQFWLNVDDVGVEDYLKIYTELDKNEIDAVMNEFQSNKSGRVAQKKLAFEVTKIIHGPKIASGAQTEAQQLSESASDMNESNSTVFDVKSGASIIDTLAVSGLTSSKTEARQLLASGGIYINDKQVAKDIFVDSDFTNGLLKLRRGKTLKNTILVKLV